MTVQTPLLSLAPFEEYMLCEDIPSHPMCFFLRLKITGRIDAALLDVSLGQAAARHPLLSSIVVQNGHKQLCWQLLAESGPSVRWQTESFDGRPLAAVSIDLENQTGLIVYGCLTTSGVELLFQFHHACCDAIGGLQLIEDVFIAYAQQVGVSSGGAHGNDFPLAWREIDPSHLSLRAKFGLTRWQLLAKIKQQAVGLIGAWQFLMRTPAQLSDAPLAMSHSASSQAFPAACTTNLTSAATDTLLSQARAAGTTLNNLLIGKLLRTLADFRGPRHPHCEDQWLRLSIPMNLRRPADECLSAANVVSMVFIDRRAEDLSDKDVLLRGIHDQMQQIKDLELGLTFPLSLRFFNGLPGAKKRMRRMSRNPRCRCTAVLSNLMRPLSNTPLPRREGRFVLGDCELTGIEFLPPVRPGTSAAFGVLTYADQLNIALHYDSNSLTPTEAEELLKIFVGHLLESPPVTHGEPPA